MAKLYFTYAAMNAGKTTVLLQSAYNYKERGMRPYLLTTAADDRVGQGVIGSRIGIESPADIYHSDTNIHQRVLAQHQIESIECVLLDEAQWLTNDQVWQLGEVVDQLEIPVMCFGLRTDFKGQTFTGSHALLAIADEIREHKTVCHCGKKATMVLRCDENGVVVKEGPQYLVGGNDTYVSVCRKHWNEEKV